MTVGIRLSDIPAGGYSVHTVNPWPGWWLAAYDPDARQGLGEATFTDDPAEAMQFEDFDAAKACWWQQSSLVPFVEDGGENRPLTPLSIIVDNIPK